MHHIYTPISHFFAPAGQRAHRGRRKQNIDTYFPKDPHGKQSVPHTHNTCLCIYGLKPSLVIKSIMFWY